MIRPRQRCGAGRCFAFELSSGKKAVEMKTPLNKIGVALCNSKLCSKPAKCLVGKDRGFQKPCHLPSETKYSPHSEAQFRAI